ncbi:hypothetical protein GOM71_11540 [Paenibacillus sp. NEAU-GSW1]|nr:hypothetical protein [Paenibacillus sp. NEAU-GSW1]MUT66561.1 hypothetical protein [Paenibacillus sp. NEAU-GSW1]
MRAQLLEGLESEGVSALNDGERALPYIRSGRWMTAAVFKWERNLFLYVECIDESEEGAVNPESLFPELHSHLADWPGHQTPRKWVPMIDVFHFNAPANAEHWRRKEKVERRVGRVAHLKPEMMSSYIYYHYQLQEEHAFFGPKYEIIAMSENLLFGYQEFPAVVEEPVLPRKLATSGTPANWGDSRMDLHFQPWEDGHLYFKPVETVFAYYDE